MNLTQTVAQQKETASKIRNVYRFINRAEIYNIYLYYLIGTLFYSETKATPIPIERLKEQKRLRETMKKFESYKYCEWLGK